MDESFYFTIIEDNDNFFLEGKDQESVNCCSMNDGSPCVIY